MGMSNKYPLVILEGGRHRQETKLLQDLKGEESTAWTTPYEFQCVLLITDTS